MGQVFEKVGRGCRFLRKLGGVQVSDKVWRGATVQTQEGGGTKDCMGIKK